MVTCFRYNHMENLSCAAYRVHNLVTEKYIQRKKNPGRYYAKIVMIVISR